MASDLSATIYVSREVSVFLLLVVVMHPYRWSLKVTMASSLSATIYEPSVSVAGGDASVSMEPEGNNGQQLISHHL